MNAYTFYRQFIKQLESLYSSGEVSVITSIIFEKIVSLKKIDLITSRDLELTDEQKQKLDYALKDLMNNKPVQYITGEAWFFKLKFEVDSSVLIPRPETEELVSIVIDFIKNNKLKNLVDIGTGSGCIAISVKKNIPELNVSALDISVQALSTALKNANSNQTQINFTEIDFLDEQKWKQLKTFDVIVSNPPYIPYSENNLIPNNVKEYEPELALFVDEALIFYKKIASFGKKHLNTNGKIFMEVHEDFANQVLQYFIGEGYEGEIIKDLLGKQRFVIAGFPD